MKSRGDVLRIVNLGLKVEGKTVLQNVNLYIKEGETYALFGPNGSGKSSLLSAIIGNPTYKVTSGRIIFKGVEINDLPTDQRIKLGMGIAFQNPPKVSGVRLIDVLRYCAGVGKRSEEEIYRYAEKLKMDDFLERPVNWGFSGGEIKRCELLQLLLLNRDFLMLDEPDSGVDLENIGLIGDTIKEILERDLPREKRRRSGIIITHTGNILDYVDADYGVILYQGRIACMGDPEDILEEISENGYEGCIDKCLREFPSLNNLN
jgi:Fe-S cluster assembly ATP-binding protein